MGEQIDYPRKGKTKVRIPRIVFGVDTSGSMSDQTLERGFDEMREIQKVYKNDFLVVECDAAVQKTYTLKRYSLPDKRVKGRGGTSFVPMFNHLKDKQCDLLIFFTDTWGDWPSKKPPYKVVILVEEERSNLMLPDWPHTVIKIDKEEKK